MNPVKDNYGDPPLFEAASQNNYLAVELILKYSKTVVNPFSSGNTDILKWKNSREETPLYIAVKRGFIEIVDLLMTSGSSSVEEGVYKYL